jgi:hypothetical protein
MVETTLDIRVSGDGRASVTVETSAAGETARQAELLCVAHYAARTLSPGASATPASASVHVVARYLSTRTGPRGFLRVRKRGGSSERLLDVLRERQGLTEAAAFVATLATKGRLSRGNEVAAALAAADAVWDGSGGEAAADLECPACGSAGPFEPVLWPSDTAAIRKCAACGAGIWLRRRRRPRVLSRRTWDELESLRETLAAGDSPSLLDELRQAFIENRWPFAEVRGVSALVSELSGPQGSWKFYAQAVDEQSLVLLYSICPLRVPPERRDEVADLITRTNYGLAAGNFELDFEDGEVRYKTALHVQGDRLDSRFLKRVVRANGLAMERYLGEVLGVISSAPIENEVK